MPKDVRKEQLFLLKFEQKLAGLAALLGTAGAAAAVSAADKLNGEATVKAYEDLQAALVHLADVTTKTHAAMQASMVELGVKGLEASGGGTPKDPPSEVVRLLLGIG